MKKWLLPLLLMFSSVAFSQTKTKSFSEIDWRVEDIPAAPVKILSKELTDPYSTQLEKVRAIFKWITDHIDYNTIIFHPNFNSCSANNNLFASDTTWLSKNLDEYVADKALQKGSTLCDGYARLFKALCDYAGIESEVITGYVRTNIGTAGKQFRCNHKWNAVMIEDNWYLLDATWASGYIGYDNQFTRDYNDYYFLTPPKDFIRNHYPEDLSWTLLNDPPTLAEFNHTPFKNSSFGHYKISSFYPSKGIIDATVGDTITIQLETTDDKKQLFVLNEFDADSSCIAELNVSVGNKKDYSVNGNIISYKYVVQSNDVPWLQVVYNNDVIMRYRLNIKQKTNNNSSFINADIVKSTP